MVKKLSWSCSCWLLVKTGKAARKVSRSNNSERQQLPSTKLNYGVPEATNNDEMDADFADEGEVIFANEEVDDGGGTLRRQE